jgi:hypothetical protein
VLLVLALPWIHFRTHLSMNPDLAASGLRALDLVESGDDANADPAKPPPLPIWLQSVALTLPFGDKPLAAALPATMFGILCGLVIYRLGAVWFSPSVGVLSASLLVCNRTFLEQIRAGEPGPIVLFFTLASLWAFAEHVQRQEDVFSTWTIIGGVAIAGLFLTAGSYAFLIAALGLAAMFFRGSDDDEDSFVERVKRSAVDPTTRAGVITLLLGLAIASPWLANSPGKWGPWLPWDEPNIVPPKIFGWWDVASDAPALVVLACFGLVQSIQSLWRHREGSGRDAMPVVWTILAAAAFHFFASTSTGLLVLWAPMFLLASKTILGVLERQVADRQVLWLASASLALFIVCQIAENRNLPRLIREGMRFGRNDWLAVGAGLGVIACSIVALTCLYRWTGRSDGSRRAFFGVLVVTVLALACAPGFMLLRSRPRSDDPWTMIQQRLASIVNRENPDSIFILDSAATPGRREPRVVIPEFIVRTLAPGREHRVVTTVEDFERRLTGFERPLVLITEQKRPLPKIYSFAHGAQAMTIAERLDTDRVAVYLPLGSKITE